MKQLVQAFPEQLKQALEIGEQAILTFPDTAFQNVVIAGLGGSGIGGNLVYSIVCDELQIPVTVSKGYKIPGFVNERTLFIASSFSGNTEETIDSVGQALECKATIVCVTSGGELLNIVQKNALPHIVIPGESKSPRACLGYSVVQMLFVLHKAGLISANFKNELKNSLNFLKQEQENIKEQAQGIAAKLHDKLPILYADGRFEPVAIRSQQQINENSKQFCHVNFFPEMNHNELVGWVFPEKIISQSVVMFLKSDLNHPRVELRMQLCKPIFEQKAHEVLDIESKGKSFIEQAFYLIHLFDWISVYLADANNIDPNPVKVIDYLKSELAKA